MAKKITPFEKGNIKEEVEKENFDIKKIFNTLIRRKKILFLTASVLFSISTVNLIYQRLRNPIFKGSFSLLISDPIQNNSNLKSKNNFASALTNKQDIDLSTLIEVLKSPSVLLEIASKFNMNPESLSQSISINTVFNKLGRADGVLKVSMISNDPKKLKFLLEDVSKAYVNASVQERQKKLVDGLDFLSNQEPVLVDKVDLVQNELLSLRKKNTFIFPENNLDRTNNLRERLQSAKSTFKEDSNLVLSLEEKLQKDFQLKPEVQKEYESIDFKLRYALSNLESLSRAKEEFKLSLAQTSVPWKIITQPVVNSKPFKPSIPYSLATSIIFAFLGGMALALLRERFDYVYHDIDEIKAELNLPILGSIPYYSVLEGIRGTKTNVLKLIEEPFFDNKKDFKDEDIKIKNYSSFAMQEAFRNFFTNIKFIDDNKKTHSVLITSSVPSEGKTISNIILAKSISDLGYKVLLIDCDLRKSQIHQRLGINNLKGFADLFFDDNYKWSDAVRSVKNHKNFGVITAGSKIIDPLRLLSSEKLKTIISDITNSEKYDYVIYDSPPTYSFPDGSYIAKNLDGLILMITFNQVSKEIPKKVIEQLNLSGIDILGVATNSLKHRPEDDEMNSYYSEYYKNDEDENVDSATEKEVDSLFINKLKNLKEKSLFYFESFLRWLDS